MMEANLEFFRKVKVQLLKALRGEKSQIEMSRDLGFSFNQWNKWETEQKVLKWDEFLDILNRLRLPYFQIFQDVFAIRNTEVTFEILLEYLTSGMSSEEISSLLKTDESTLRRWKREHISPSIELIFLLISQKQGTLHTLLSRLVPIEKIQILGGEFKQLSLLQSHEARYPFSGALEACLELKDYQAFEAHNLEWVAQRVRVSPQLVTEALENLKVIGAVKWENQKYTRVRNWVSMTGIDPVDAAKVDHYWTEYASARYHTNDGVPLIPNRPVNTNIRSYRVAAVSESTALEIQKKLRQTSQEILSLIQSDEAPKDLVVLYLSHFFDVSDVDFKSELQFTDNIHS